MTLILLSLKAAIKMLCSLMFLLNSSFCSHAGDLNTSLFYVELLWSGRATVNISNVMLDQEPSLCFTEGATSVLLGPC